jgi:ABC-type enterochelin transport system substrate-binding protein
MPHPTNNPTPAAGKPVTVSCVDAVGRVRQVTVTRSRGRVVLRTPPGEVAILDPASADLLANALHTTTANPPPADPGARGTTGRRP